MKKNKILLVCALALGLPSAVSSLMHNVEPIVARADNTSGISTYKIASSTSITGTNTPLNSTCAFKNTYTANKEQLTKGNTATLTINNANQYTITSLKLKMKSNSKKGAGKLMFKNDQFQDYEYLIGNATTGVNFDGWYTSFSTAYVDINIDISNMSSKSFTSIFELKIESTENSLYIQSYEIGWKLDETIKYHNVIFNTNGGNTLESIQVQEGKEIDVSSYVPTKEGSVFCGWYTDIDCTDSNVFVNGVMGSSDINLYAKWRDEKVFDKFVDVKTNTNLKFNYTKSDSNLVTESIDFTKQNYKNGETISSYNGDNYDVKFDNNSNSNSPKYYSSGTAIRVYNDNSLTISSTNQNIKNIKLVLSEKYSDGVSKLILSSGVANTSEENIILIQNTNSLSITIKNSGSSQLRIQQIIINEQTVTYSNFNNLQIQYQYSFDVSSYTEVQEVGIFVTDDEKFEFYNDGFYNDEMTFEESLSTNTKGHRFVNSNKKETYTVGVNLGDDIKSAVLTTFRACAYVKTNDNKYYFSKNISKYNLQTMLEEYSKLTLEGEGNAIVDSFLSYVNSL